MNCAYLTEPIKIAEKRNGALPDIGRIRLLNVSRPIRRTMWSEPVISTSFVQNTIVSKVWQIITSFENFATLCFMLKTLQDFGSQAFNHMLRLREIGAHEEKAKEGM